MQRAWSASVTHGFNPSYTPTIYPFDCAGTSFYAFSGFANPFGNCGLGSWGTGLGAIYLETEEWLSGNEDVSNHEYGHALMHRAYSNEWYPNTGGGSHSVFPQPTGFAWSEGWATFYTQIVNNDGNYNGWGNLETKSSIPNSTTGEVNEWRVAQALVDLWDTNVDGEDNSHILYSKFISTMQSNNSNNLTTFWSQLKNTLPSWEKYFGSKSLIYNTIPVVLESYTFLSVSISGPTSLEFKQQGTWTANVSGGSGSHTYKWYRSSDGGSSWGGVIGTSSTFTTTMLFNDFVLRCDILDTQTNETDSDTHNVEYFDGLPKKASDVQERPNSYALNSNYPNPFNPTTTIKYQLKENGFVSLKVFDLLGKEVASLVNENKSAGFYETVFDASDLTSGLYIYKLTVNGFVSTKKMLLTK
ncbi:MAG: T9SS type A sorting domain-containing protein [Ignavibacteriae bacterium]|nr:T9SS type A sorting domain-containing protein [Ignavibacteriota bacterium]